MISTTTRNRKTLPPGTAGEPTGGPSATVENRPGSNVDDVARTTTVRGGRVELQPGMHARGFWGEKEEWFPGTIVEVSRYGCFIRCEEPDRDFDGQVFCSPIDSVTVEAFDPVGGEAQAVATVAAAPKSAPDTKNPPPRAGTRAGSIAEIAKTPDACPIVARVRDGCVEVTPGMLVWFLFPGEIDLMPGTVLEACSIGCFIRPDKPVDDLSPGEAVATTWARVAAYAVGPTTAAATDATD